MEPETQQTSKYNSGVAIIMRLDSLWKDTHTHSRAGLFAKWNADLDRIWCELSRDLNDKKYPINKKLFDDLNKTIELNGGFNDRSSEAFNKISAGIIIQRNKQYKALIEKELFLRRLENSVGKGTAWDDDDLDYMNG